MTSPLYIFYCTFAIVLGVISPVAIIAVVWTLGDFIRFSIGHAIRVAEYKAKQPPYDKCVLRAVPNPNMLSVILIKDGKELLSIGADKP